MTLTRARRSLGIRLLLRRSVLLLLLSDTEWRLLQRRLLAELRLLLPVGLELVVHCASGAYCQPHDLTRLLELQPRTYQRAQETVAQKNCLRMCATCST